LNPYSLFPTFHFPEPILLFIIIGRDHNETDPQLFHFIDHVLIEIPAISKYRDLAFTMIAHILKKPEEPWIQQWFIVNIEE